MSQSGANTHVILLTGLRQSRASQMRMSNRKEPGHWALIDCSFERKETWRHMAELPSWAA